MFHKSIKILILGMVLLQGCLDSDKPLPNRETVSANSPLIGYWKATTSNSEDGPMILSIFYIGQSDYLFVIASPQKMYSQDEIESAATDKDVDIYEAYLTRYHEKAYASLRAKSNDGTGKYEIVRYGLTGNDILSLQIADWEKLDEVIKAANFAPEQYNSSAGVLTMDATALMEFVSSLREDIFNAPVVFEKIIPHAPTENTIH